MTMHFQKEKLSTCQKEMEPLFLRQYEENEDGEFGLDPDYETYLRLEELDILHIYTVRDGETLVGYLVLIVHEMLHHKGIKYALSDIIYVAPEYRNSRIAAELITMAKYDLQDMGVKRFIMAMKVRQEFRRLLSKLGFHPEEELWEIKL
jgi:GNAT superfamily N-acetyltransferase